MIATRAPRRSVASIDAIVVGGGPFGLAMSQALSARALEHVVLERGEVGHAWRTERWDSLRLLTPNWMTRLPGHAYDGADPHGYMSAAELARFLSAYAAKIAAPVLTGTAVWHVTPQAGGYRVATNRGDWHARAVVLASGAFSQPVVPRVADALPADVEQLTAHAYRQPAQLRDGGVLVVGASATGLQLAQEIHASGRQVTLAVGEHVRMPRIYRGRDIQWWLLAAGVLDQRIEDLDDPERARRVPSPQLAGTPERATLDLNTLRQQGVTLVGRLMGVRDGKAQFSGSLRNVCALADLKMSRLLDLFDDWAHQRGIDDEFEPPQRFAATEIGGPPKLGSALGHDIRTVVWATGFRPDHSWLDVPVFDRHGQLMHDRGVVRAPGLYVLGRPFLRRRKSSFIHGAEDDVHELAAHLAAHLDRTRPAQVNLSVAA